MQQGTVAVSPVHGGSGFLEIPHYKFMVIDLLLVLFSAADILFTWAVLNKGGEEVNPLARLVLDSWQLTGLVVYKYTLIVLVILLCERVGRCSEVMARSVLLLGIVLTCVPVVWSTWLLMHH
ncbi:MAG: hypothetical protein EXS00_06450 [Phycisphaerales bacterium]|nr:hypothetical protein [Phycisphaerales bacterium]